MTGAFSELKPKFGQNGFQILTGYPVVNHTFADMNIQSGKLLLSLRKIIGGSYHFVLLRLNSGGTIDGTFGNAGESLTGLRGFGGNGTVIETNGKITVSGVKLDDSSAKELERKLSNGQTDLSFIQTSVNSVESLGPGLVKMSNGKYALRTANLAGNGSMTMVLDKFSSNGIFESSVSPFNGFPVTSCPEVFTNQTDGKVLLQFAGILFRLNAELDFSTLETNYCSNLSGMTNFVRAAIQPDDKMVVAGIYNDYLTIVRLLPN